MPIDEPYKPLADPSINPLIRRGNDIVKRFVSPATSTSGGGNGVTSLDDPTYLGFSLRFVITSPLFNGATNGDPGRPPSETPFFDALNEEASARGLTGGVSGDDGSKGQFSPIITGPSAIGYLDEVGDVTRSSYLQSFIQGLREVNDYRPYYWQTIEGLQEAWGKTLDFEDPFIGSKDAEGITIGCLEAIDLKISALFNLYKAAIYDVSYRRMVIPKNLMYFDVYVDVFEIRQFKSTRTWLSKLSKNSEPSDVDKFLNDNTSKITFKFSDCLWVPAESGKVFENVTNAGGNEMTVTSMKWEYGSVSIESDFAGIDQALSDNLRMQSKGGLKGAVKNAAKAQAQKAANAVLNRAEGAIRAGVSGLVLGNVFGLRNQILGTIQNPGALASALEGALIPSSRSVASNSIKLGDNPLGEGLQPNNSLPSENINLGRIPQPNSPLGSSNVFGPGPSGPPPLNSNNVFG